MKTLVIGSGPGGATVARELARAGEEVVILERGRDWRGSRWYGTYPGALQYAERGALLFTPEGMNVVRPMMLGGTTSMYCGCSAPPGDWWRDRYGIDLIRDAENAARELGVAPLPAELRGPVSTRIADAGDALGMTWAPQDKFMSPNRSRTFDCGARCMLGCRCGAKWNAAEWIDDAVRSGARLRTGTRVERLLIASGSVAGAETDSGERIEADRVVVAAGGIGSAALLRRSGIERAGDGIAMDTTAMVYGTLPVSDARQGDEPPMTWSCPDDELGVLYSTLIDPWLMYPLVLAAGNPGRLPGWRRWGRTLGLMIKLKDEISGGVDERGRVSKGLTTADRERLEVATERAGQILNECGCDPDSIFRTPIRGTHPSATCRIGSVVDNNLATELPGLYVADASVFPEALARPTVLTIIALAKRLVREELLAVSREEG